MKSDRAKTNANSASLFDRILLERATRLGISPEEALQSLYGTSTPATALGAFISPETLARDLSKLASSEYPTIECLMPYELDEFGEKGLKALDADRLEHVRTCMPCASLLVTICPTESKLKEFIRRANRFITAGQTY